MKVYIVRHGESKFNAKKIHQHGNVALSMLGLKQARSVSNRFKKIPIDIILASPYARAHQTAQAISRVIKKKIITNPLLREFKRPTEIEGKPFNDTFAVGVKTEIHKHFSEPNWHYSDEENFFDLLDRAFEFTDHLSNRSEENILIVSHEITIQCVILSMMFGKEVDPMVYLRFHEFFRSKNTGITMLEKTETGNWHLLAWNDHAHLG